MPKLVSRHLGTAHETFRLTAASTDLLPKLLWHLDEPLADATIIPTYLLSQATRRQVTVALSGEGGDELFAGYTHYQGMQLNRWLSAAAPLVPPRPGRGRPPSAHRRFAPPGLSGTPPGAHRRQFPLSAVRGIYPEGGVFHPGGAAAPVFPGFSAPDCRPSPICSTSGPFPRPIRTLIPSPRPIWRTSRSFCRTACWSRWTA